MIFGALVDQPGRPRRTDVYRYAEGVLSAVARYGDVMPDGWLFSTANARTWGLNDYGDLVFSARTRTLIPIPDLPGLFFGLSSMGVYASANGTLQYVMRDGVTLFGAGYLAAPPVPTAIIGSHGDVVFSTLTRDWATFEPIRHLLLKASPQLIAK